jgi:hypothetical protein
MSGDAHGENQPELPPAHADRNEHRRRHHHQHAGGAKIGLLQHQCRRNHHEQGRHDQRERPPHILVGEAVKIARQGHDQRDLHDLGGLQLHHAEIDPALGAHTDLAGKIDPDQQQDRNQIGRIDETHQRLQVDHRDREHHREADREARRLPVHPGIGAAMGGGIEHGEADRGDAADQEDHRPAHLRDLVAPSHPIARGDAELRTQSHDYTRPIMASPAFRPRCSDCAVRDRGAGFRS